MQQGHNAHILVHSLIKCLSSIYLSVYLFSCKDIGLVLNTEKTKYMEKGRHRGMIANAHIKIGSIFYEK